MNPSSNYLSNPFQASQSPIGEDGTGSPHPPALPEEARPSEMRRARHSKPGETCLLIQGEILHIKDSSQLLTSKTAFAKKLSTSLAETSSWISVRAILHHLGSGRCRFMSDSGRPRCKQVWDEVFNSQKQIPKTQRLPRDKTTTCLLIQREILRMKDSSQLLTSKNAFVEELSKSQAGTSTKTKASTIRHHLANVCRCKAMTNLGNQACKKVWDEVFNSQEQMRKTQGPPTKTCRMIQQELRRMVGTSQQLSSKIAFARELLKNQAGTGEKLHLKSICDHLAGRNCKTMRKMGHPGCKQVWDECRDTQKQTRKSQRGRPPSPKNPTKQKRARTGTEPVQSGASSPVPMSVMILPPPMPKQVAQASPMPMGMTTEAQKEEHVETMPSPPKDPVWTPDSHVEFGYDLSAFDTSARSTSQQQQSKQWMEADDPFRAYDPLSLLPAQDLDASKPEGRAYLTGSLNLDDGDDLQPDAYHRDYSFL